MNFNPNQALWRAVILQAILDITKKYTRTEDILASEEALKFLKVNSKKLIYVCHLANLDPSYVIRKTRYALQHPEIWRRTCDLKNFIKKEI